MPQRSAEWQWDSVAERRFCYNPRLGYDTFEDGTPRQPIQRPRNLPSGTRDPPTAGQYSTSPQSHSKTYEVQGAISHSATREQPKPAERAGVSQYAEDRHDRQNLGQPPLTYDFARINLNADPSSRAPPPVRTEQREWTDKNGDRFVYARNPASQVQTTLKVGPAERITDPAFFKQGIKASQLLLPTAGEEEKLFQEYKRRDQPRRFFTRGKVFRVLWTEPAGDNRTAVTFEGFTTGVYGERVFSKVRLFVVIREADNYCSALPIVTYGGQGVSKPGVRKSEYSVIYSGKNPPPDFKDEAPRRGEEGMRPDAIRINPDDREDLLAARSRIHYGKVHTIEHNVKVKPYGQVHPSSVAALRHQFLNVWLGETAAGAVARSGSDSGTSNNPAPTKGGQKQTSRRPSQSVPNTAGSSSQPHGSGPSADEVRKAQMKAAVQRLKARGMKEDDAIQFVEEQDRAHRSSQADQYSDDDSESDAGDEESTAPASAKRSTGEGKGLDRAAEGKKQQDPPHPPRSDSKSQERRPPARQPGSSLPANKSPAGSLPGPSRAKAPPTMDHKSSEAAPRSLTTRQPTHPQPHSAGQQQQQQYAHPQNPYPRQLQQQAEPYKQNLNQQQQSLLQQQQHSQHRDPNQRQPPQPSQAQQAHTQALFEYYTRFYTDQGYPREQSAQWARDILTRQPGTGRQ